MVHALCICYLLYIHTWNVNTQTELLALKNRSEKAESDLGASTTMNQKLSARNEKMAVSYGTLHM